MAIPADRIVTEKVIKVSETNSNPGGGGMGGGGASSFASAANFEPKGLIQNLPNSLGDYSSFKDLVNASVSSIEGVKSRINKALTVPNIDMINQKLSGLAGEYNLNQNIVNKTLCIVKAALCGDSDALLFDLSAIIEALDYDFDFLRSFNICGRQKFRNPVDTLLRGIDNLERQSRLVAGIPNRFMNNLKGAVRTFIRNSNLPMNIEACLTNKAILQGGSILGDGLSLGEMKDFITELSNKICTSDVGGLKPRNSVVEKAAVAPFIQGMTTYDKATMYSSISGILSKNAADKTIILEVLSESFGTKDNKNSVNTLELIAFTKLTTTVVNDKIPTSISSINKELHQHKGSESVVLDRLLEANDKNQVVPSTDLTYVKDKFVSDIDSSCNVNAKQIITNFADDLSETKNPEEKFNQIMKLIQIADKKFNPEENADLISSCHSLGSLAERALLATKEEGSKTVLRKDKDGTYMEVIDDDLSFVENVGVLHYADHMYAKECDAFSA